MTDVEALTLTIWGEARGEPIQGKVGVAMVMRNRVLSHYRGALTFVAVCTAHAQFSAWTDEAAQMQAEQELLTGDPTLARHPDPVLRLCLEIAKATIAGELADNTRNSNHYVTSNLYKNARPNWANGVPALTLGNHVFFNVD